MYVLTRAPANLGYRPGEPRFLQTSHPWSLVVRRVQNQNKPEKAIYVGAFIEFATIEVAMHVINTVKEYRGVETNVNWGHRSLVESIKEQRQRQAQQEQQLDGGAAKMDGQDEDREGGTSTSVQVLDLVLHGTLYEDMVFEEEAACDAVHRDAVDPIGLFIQEQAQRWHHELQAYYAMSTPNPMMPMSHPSTGVPTAHAVPMPHGPHASTLRPLHPHVQMAGPAMFHHHSMQGMATAQVMYHPAGLPITPLPQRFF